MRQDGSSSLKKKEQKSIYMKLNWMMSALKNVICSFLTKHMIPCLKSRMWKWFYLVPEDIFLVSNVQHLFGKL